MEKFTIEIWFDGIPKKRKLGTVEVYAEDDMKALELAIAHTEHWMVAKK